MSTDAHEYVSESCRSMPGPPSAPAASAAALSTSECCRRSMPLPNVAPPGSAKLAEEEEDDEEDEEDAAAAAEPFSSMAEGFRPSRTPTAPSASAAPAWFWNDTLDAIASNEFHFPAYAV